MHLKSLLLCMILLLLGALPISQERALDIQDQRANLAIDKTETINNNNNQWKSYLEGSKFYASDLSQGRHGLVTHEQNQGLQAPPPDVSRPVPLARHLTVKLCILLQQIQQNLNLTGSVFSPQAAVRDLSIE